MFAEKKCVWKNKLKYFGCINYSVMLFVPWKQRNCSESKHRNLDEKL